MLLRCFYAAGNRNGLDFFGTGPELRTVIHYILVNRGAYKLTARKCVASAISKLEQKILLVFPEANRCPFCLDDPLGLLLGFWLNCGTATRHTSSGKGISTGLLGSSAHTGSFFKNRIVCSFRKSHYAAPRSSLSESSPSSNAKYSLTKASKSFAALLAGA